MANRGWFFRNIRCIFICLFLIVITIVITKEVVCDDGDKPGSATPVLRRIRLINTSSEEIKEYEVYSIKPNQATGVDEETSVHKDSTPIPPMHAHGADADEDGFLASKPGMSVSKFRVEIRLNNGKTLKPAELVTNLGSFGGILIGVEDSQGPEERNVVVVGFYAEQTMHALQSIPTPLPTTLSPEPEQ